MNYEQLAKRRSRTAASWQKNYAAGSTIISVGGQACERPLSPSREHLAALDLLLGAAGCPFPVIPQRAEDNAFTPIAKHLPWTTLPHPPLMVLALTNNFCESCWVEIGQVPPSGTQFWGACIS